MPPPPPYMARVIRLYMALPLREPFLASPTTYVQVVFVVAQRLHGPPSSESMQRVLALAHGSQALLLRAGLA